MKPHTIESFIAKSREIHGDYYSYDKAVIPKTGMTGAKVTITCPVHGDFIQFASSHLSGSGCKQCFITRSANQRRTTFDEWKEQCAKRHDNRYDYSLIDNYHSTADYVTIVCPDHGEFVQNAGHHREGTRCPKCSLIIRARRRSRTTEHFIQQSKLIHKNKYSYEKAKYVRGRSHVIITCPTHGDFEQTANNHLDGCGCPQCGTVISRPHQAIADFLDRHNVEYLLNDRSLLNGLELDIYIPSHHLAIEVNGIYWHSSKFRDEPTYHQDKTDACKGLRVQLINLWDIEILQKPSIVESMLLFSLGLSPHTLNANDLTIKTLTSKEYKNFLVENHILGYASSGLRIGLTTGESKLVSVLGADITPADEIEIIRYSTRKNTVITNGLTSLINELRRRHPNMRILASTHDAYENESVYRECNPKLINMQKPERYYTSGKKIFKQPDPNKKLYELWGNSIRKWVLTK